MKVILIIVGCLAALGAALNSEWEQYKKEHGKTYIKAVEERQRYSNFMVNKIEIEAHNLKYEKGDVTFQMGLNKLSDMTSEEYQRTMMTYRRSPQVRPTKTYQSTGAALPDTIDWRLQGAVTPIKDQNQDACESGDWAFSTTGAIEGQMAIVHNNMVSLSEQQLLDCCSDLNGCNGGNSSWAYSCIGLDNGGGILAEASYPYEATVGQCKYNQSLVVANVYAYVGYEMGDESALQDGVAFAGPIAVAVDASHSSFMNYRTGVYYEAACSTTNLTHAMLVIGYGNLNGINYWLVKNSWGDAWGDGGYIMMTRNDENQCGIATEATYPLIDPLSTQ